jgi:hypothetical protein
MPSSPEQVPPACKVDEKTSTHLRDQDFDEEKHISNDNPGLKIDLSLLIKLDHDARRVKLTARSLKASWIALFITTVSYPYAMDIYSQPLQALAHLVCALALAPSV